MIKVQHFYDPATFTLSYVVFDPKTKDAIVIDPVLDYDPLSSKTATKSLETLVRFVRENDLRVHLSLETHAHADHLSGSPYLRRVLGAKVAIGADITKVQGVFKGVFDLGDSFAPDGSQFDLLAREGEPLTAGSITVDVISTPGHTPACVTYAVEDALFTGDALFIEDYGTGRCDFPMGSAEDLYVSVHDKLYARPDSTRVFVGHDYQPGGRALRFETTIGKSKAENIQLKAATDKETYVSFRKARDATLAAPRLLYPSVQVNIDGGRLPKPAGNGVRYLKIPLDRGRAVADDGGPAES